MTTAATRRRSRRDVENTDYAGFARRILRAMGKRVSAGDIDALPELVALRDEVDTAIEDSVAALRSEPYQYSWAQIGAVLGMTRQSAQQRWGHVEVKGGRKVGGQPHMLR